MTELLRAFFRLTLLPPIRAIYRLRVLHADRVPAAGGLLLVSNHVSYLDSFILYAACPRPVRFIIVSRYLGSRAISWFLRLFGAIPLTPGRSRDAIRAAAACLESGDVVCIFPEGQLTRTGMLNELKKGFEIIARKAGAPVQAVWMQGLWGSIFSFERGRYFRKLPRRRGCPVTVAFGEPQPDPDRATIEWAEETLRALSAEALPVHPELETSLAAALVRGLKRRPGSPCFAEHGSQGRGAPRRFRRHQVLSVAIALSARWRETLPAGESAIGVFLPSGVTPALINLGLILAGRVPVNLPFPDTPEGTLDPDRVSADLRVAGVRTVITSRAFLGALGGVTWPDGDRPGQFLDMGAEMGAAGLGRRLWERVLAFVEPAWMTVRRLELPPRGGEPSPAWTCVGGGRRHEFSDLAVLAQAGRLTLGNWLEKGEVLFTEQNLATPGGALWSLWLPVLHGFTAAGRSWAARGDDPLVETLCREEGVRRLVLSPAAADALAAAGEPWHPAQRAALRSVIVPREGDPTGSSAGHHPLESVVGAPVCPAWAPEALDAGVLAISQPDLVPEPGKPLQLPQVGRRPGSPGRLLPGIAVRTRPEGTGIQVRGPGLGDGLAWIDLGASTTLDAEGFLHFEGKLSD